ncbi:MAG: cytochrome c, partial [Planctomycetes bacterium]|nr:cytochrome c [Planctomycetota bacterium]
AASIARGRAMFVSSKVNCARCHGVSARGDGKATREYQQKKGGGSYPGPGLFDDWGHQIKPRDLTRGIYRGGRRPIDIYRRISAGIKGTPMPGFGTLPDEEIWDLVNYVLSIPMERR